MALNVTYTAPAPTAVGLQVEDGNSADTETIAVGASSTAGAKSATSTARLVSLLADEDCWIAIGATPTAASGSGRKMLAGERLQFWCDVGDSVAVIQV